MPSAVRSPMKPLARSMISLVLILDSPLTPAHGRVGGQEQAHFEIRLPLDLNSEQAQIRYFLTGAFGGYGSFVREERGKHAYRIATTVEGKPADALRAVVYAPGLSDRDDLGPVIGSFAGSR